MRPTYCCHYGPWEPLRVSKLLVTPWCLTRQPVRTELASPWGRNGRLSLVSSASIGVPQKQSISPCLTMVPYSFKASPCTPIPRDLLLPRQG